MAIITESKKLMDDTLDKVWIRFRLDPEDGVSTLAQRLRYEVEYEVARDDGNTPRRESATAIVTDDISTFSPGDAAALRALLKKLYDDATSGI